VKNLVNGVRPSVLSAACTPALAAASVAQSYALGQPAVRGWVAASAFGLHAGRTTSVKINNYTGTISAQQEVRRDGMATLIEGRIVSAARIQSVQVDKVKGGTARGIPPRGRPV
jgi:hypothetical protein